jgi:hypothetical protein
MILCRRSHANKEWKTCNQCASRISVKVLQRKKLQVRVNVERNLGSCKTPFDPQWRRQIRRDLDNRHDISHRPLHHWWTPTVQESPSLYTHPYLICSIPSVSCETGRVCEISEKNQSWIFHISVSVAGGSGFGQLGQPLRVPI